MSLFYDAAYLLAAVFTSPVWAVKLWRTGKWRTDWPARFGRCQLKPAPTETRRIIIHAVSVGEVNAIERLVAALDRDPMIQVVIATTTDTGFARATKLFADHHTVVRYPLDFSFAVKRFLNATEPHVLVLVELEVWPQMLKMCAERDIPVCVVNGRLSQRSLQRYRWVAPVVKRTFSRLAAAGVQSPAYAQRFVALGAAQNRVHVLDTMKWDTAEVADTVPGADQLARAMGIDHRRPVIVAGSTGPGEEKMLLEQCPQEAQLIIVPRKPERFDQVAALEPAFIRRSTSQQGKPGQGRFFLLDTMGELAMAYSLASVVVVGRSFNGMGGSDPIQPIALGKPTIIGPSFDNFAEVVEAFEQAQGIVVTDNPGRSLQELLADSAKRSELARCGRDVVLSRQGATDRYASMVRKVLEHGHR